MDPKITNIHFSKKGHVQNSRGRFGWGILPLCTRTVGLPPDGGVPPRAQNTQICTFPKRGMSKIPGADLAEGFFPSAPGRWGFGGERGGVPPQGIPPRGIPPQGD